ncbi:YfiR family protein [Methylocucumis oryzae]|uniref:YfiR family protein n=1 Tax=Methylocucumis oryzae TaxID=1632867 RepID=UPI0009E235A7
MRLIFAEQGGIIGFTVKDNRLSFEVNLATATLAHVYINAKLLKLARYVYSD